LSGHPRTAFGRSHQRAGYTGHESKENHREVRRIIICLALCAMPGYNKRMDTDALPAAAKDVPWLPISCRVK
jgi:hypothetical protein